MMGIYIKTLKIPETCRDCFLFETCRYGNKLLQCRADECPIEETSAPYGMEELPASHGRLIDADVLIQFIKNQHVPKFDIKTGEVILQMIDKMHKYN